MKSASPTTPVSPLLECGGTTSVRFEVNRGRNPDADPREDRRRRLALILAAVTISVCAGSSGRVAGAYAQEAEGDAATARFDRTIAPLLSRRCLSCHNATDKKGGLDLSASGPARAGGKQGVVLVPGKPEESLLWERVEAGEMPPKTPLSEAEKDGLREWIASGAEWGTTPIDPLRFGGDRRAGYDWWSLQPITRPGPPTATGAGAMVKPIDAFILARLAERGLTPSPEADRRTLIRRLAFDLLGLPPTPEEVEAYVTDPDSQAYERLVDRYLASPQFGQRWARHWLDVVRFAETQGFEYNRLWPDAWRYRDWVIEAFNADIPYDQFVRLQLAGDVLEPDDPTAIVATGQLVVGPYDQTMQDEGTAAMRAAAREEELEGIVGTAAQAYLGLTVHCARCHDHKFDPIRQEDYYRLAAALGGVRFGERQSVSEAGAEASRLRSKALAWQITALKNRKSAEEPARRPALLLELVRLEARRGLWAGGPAHVVTPRQPPVFHVLARGDYRQPGAVVAPAGIAAVTGPPADFGLAPDAPEAQRRKALARWITDPRHPLTARVIVNRLWQHHFGVGLVDTPNDFGFNGGRPSHPELLDWLASELIRQKWSLKAIHRAIVLSSVYLRSSGPRPDLVRVDVDNRFLGRREPRRLEAEALRDAVLAVSGGLDVGMGGPGFLDVTTRPGPSSIYEPTEPTGPGSHRRSIYRTWVRAGAQPLLDALDCPEPSVSTPRRATTTTPLQALALLNDGFMLDQAEAFAGRLRRESGGDVGAQIVRAYRLALGRTPDSDEQRAARAFVADHGLAPFCLALFNTNEFLYVD
jgi:hypothetical protein